MADSEPALYIFVGYDHNSPNDPFPTLLHPLKGKSNVHIIYADPHVPVNEAMKQVKGPHAHVIFAMHGGFHKGFTEHGKQYRDFTMVQWTEKGANSEVFFFDLLKALPKKGVDSIGALSCYGGDIESWFGMAPPGAAVYALTSSKTLGWSHSDKFVAATIDHLTTANLIISAFAHVDPNEYVALNKKYNEAHKSKIDINPADILSREIGIGGFPMIPIRLDKEIQQKKFDPKIMNRATVQVQERFHAETNKFVALFTGEERDRDTLIAQVADKMMHHKSLNGYNELRIGYALVIGYMDQSGELATWQKMKATQEERFKALHDKASAIHIAGFPSLGSMNIAPKNITPDEQHFLETVKTKMKGDKELPQVIAALTNLFSETPGNDKIHTNSSGAKVLKAHHIDIKNWTR